MTKSTTCKQYAPEFKEEALRLASKIGVTEAARELEILKKSAPRHDSKVGIQGGFC